MRNKHMQTVLLLAAFFGATGVAIGAFGAHGLSAMATRYATYGRGRKENC